MNSIQFNNELKKEISSSHDNSKLKYFSFLLYLNLNFTSFSSLSKNPNWFEFSEIATSATLWNTPVSKEILLYFLIFLNSSALSNFKYK